MSEVYCARCRNKIGSFKDEGRTFRASWAKGWVEFVAQGGGFARVCCRWNDCGAVNVVPMIPVQTVEVATLLQRTA